VSFDSLSLVGKSEKVMGGVTCKFIFGRDSFPENYLIICELCFSSGLLGCLNCQDLCVY